MYKCIYIYIYQVHGRQYETLLYKGAYHDNHEKKKKTERAGISNFPEALASP